MSIEKSKLRKYPELNTIARLYPDPKIILNKRINWTEKVDGSNLRIALIDNEIMISTRHQDKASDEFINCMKMTDEYDKVVQLIKEYSGLDPTRSFASSFNFGPQIFGEILVKGKSPTGIEMHDKHEFIIFDIWDTSAQRFLPYNLLHQYCYHFSLPIVRLFGESEHETLEDLYKFRDEMIKKCVEEKREGVVLKAFDSDSKEIYCKEKCDLPKDTHMKHVEDKPTLPPLPNSELMGSIAKCHADLGVDFRDVKKAMPLIAKYVNEEKLKHLYGNPEMNLFKAYTKYLEGIQI